MKIYTRTGDTGDTGLFGGGRVPKDDPRVDAYGEVDELNAVIGWVLSAIEAADPEWRLSERFRQVQEDLLAIGAHLATPSERASAGAASHLPPLPAERAGEMEAWMDEAELELSPLRSFILPGGTEVASRLHVARTVCRRAERRVITLKAASQVEIAIVVYLNRLSDLLFTLARLANQRQGREDVPWVGRR